MLTLLAGILACTDPPAEENPASLDPTEVLVDLASVVSTDLYAALYFAVGDDVLSQMSAGDELSGALEFPADADPDHWEVNGALGLDWSVAHRDDGSAEGVRYWDWEVAVDVGALTLASAEASGTAEWTFTWEQYDYAYGHHAWTSSLSIDGDEAVPVEWTGTGTASSLLSVEGSVDGESVAWENDDPDAP